jgi:hypothetical protein
MEPCGEVGEAQAVRPVLFDNLGEPLREWERALFDIPVQGFDLDLSG